MNPQRLIRAVPIVLGMALFLFSGCAEKALKPPVPEKVTDHFALAQQYASEGLHQKALEEYRLYLEENPGGMNAPEAMYGIARIYGLTGAYDTALELLMSIEAEYPGHHILPSVGCDIIAAYYHLGEFESARSRIYQWLETFPSDPLKGRVLYLAGLSLESLGDKSGAFVEWLEAEKTPGSDPRTLEQIKQSLDALIQDALPAELEALEGPAQGTAYLPRIYYRMASLYLEENRMLEAGEAALALIRSTTDQDLIDFGRGLIDRIQVANARKEKVVGVLLPLTGSFALYGREVLNGIELGMDLFGEEGDRQGNELELIIMDTQGKPEVAVSAVEKMESEEGVSVVVGPLLSKEASAAAEKAQEKGIPIITLTQKEGITAHREMVYRNFMTPSKEVELILSRGINEFGLKRFAILYPDNVYGRFFMRLFWDRADEMGAVITSVERYRPGQADLTEEIKKMVGLYYPRPPSVMEKVEALRALEAEDKIEEGLVNGKDDPPPIVDFDAVFIPDNPQQVAQIAPQFPFNDVFDIRFLGTSLWQSQDLIQMAGDYVQGALFPSGFFKQEERENVKTFVDLYESAFESEAGILAATGYDTICTLKYLLENMPILSRKDMVAALNRLSDFYGVTGRIAFGPDGEVEKVPVLLTVSGKGFEVLR